MNAEAEIAVLRASLAAANSQLSAYRKFVASSSAANALGLEARKLENDLLKDSC